MTEIKSITKTNNSCTIFATFLFISLFIFDSAGSFVPAHRLSLVAPERGLLCSGGTQASHCSGFSCSRSMGSRACWPAVVKTGSVAMQHTESSPDKGSNLCPLHGLLTTDYEGCSCFCYFL